MEAYLNSAKIINHLDINNLEKSYKETIKSTCNEVLLFRQTMGDNNCIFENTAGRNFQWVINYLIETVDLIFDFTDSDEGAGIDLSSYIELPSISKIKSIIKKHGCIDKLKSMYIETPISWVSFVKPTVELEPLIKSQCPGYCNYQYEVVEGIEPDTNPFNIIHIE